MIPNGYPKYFFHSDNFNDKTLTLMCSFKPQNIYNSVVGISYFYSSHPYVGPQRTDFSAHHLYPGYYYSNHLPPGHQHQLPRAYTVTKTHTHRTYTQYTQILNDSHSDTLNLDDTLNILNDTLSFNESCL